MIEWLREQMGLWPGTSEFAKVNVEQFIDWLEATGALPPVLCPSCNHYEANLCGACQAQADRDAGFDDDCSSWVSVEDGTDNLTNGDDVLYGVRLGNGEQIRQQWKYHRGVGIPSWATHWVPLPTLPKEQDDDFQDDVDGPGPFP